jgi:hypothetical protein
MKDLDILVEMFARVGKPVMENAQKQYVIKPPSFVVDASWLSAKVEDAKNKQALESLLQVVSSAGIDRKFSIENFTAFIEELQIIMRPNKGLTAPTEEKPSIPVAEMLSRVNIVRVLHNLATTEGGRESAAGFGFENFLAIFFENGKALPPNKENKGNIADVQFGDDDAAPQASIKFLSGQYPTITGSILDLLKTVRKYGHIDYILGSKKGDGRIDFLYTRITEEDLVASSGTSAKLVRRWINFSKKTKSAAKKEAEKQAEKENLTPEQTEYLIKKAMEEREKGILDEKGRPIKTVFNFSTKQLKFKPLATLETSGALEVAQFLMTALNSQFNDLLSNLQQLSEKVSELTYSKDQKQQKSKAKQAATKAGDTKKSAEEIQ